MNSITTKQFLGSAFFWTLGCALWMAPFAPIRVLAPGLVAVSIAIVMVRKDQPQRFSLPHAVLILGTLIFLAFTGYFLHRFVPAEWGLHALALSRHPALVLTVWAVMMILKIRNWRRAQAFPALPRESRSEKQQ
jgi:hypothetical protein